MIPHDEPDPTVREVQRFRQRVYRDLKTSTDPVNETALRIPRKPERDGGNCQAVLQADGDPGSFPVVYVDHRGIDKSLPRYDNESNEDFSERTGLYACEKCPKYCQPALTEHHKGDVADCHFCHTCDYNARVRMLVEEELADLVTATRIVHRMIAFERPGAGIERVTVTR